ncbi:hypothetical protein LUZ60_012588 [Juncus effusus]|nr:hypothetical protein LUZ60_012588 [Juncus effusus]
MASAVSSFSCTKQISKSSPQFSLVSPKFNLFSNPNRNFQSLKTKAEPTDSKETTKTPKKSSILCRNCEGNGAMQCTQCLGTGVNSEEHFNGRFKVGGLCWLCRGKKEILCGDCNGAGFLGGFMSTCDETAS